MKTTKYEKYGLLAIDILLGLGPALLLLPLSSLGLSTGLVITVGSIANNTFMFSELTLTLWSLGGILGYIGLCMSIYFMNNYKEESFRPLIIILLTYGVISASFLMYHFFNSILSASTEYLEFNFVSLALISSSITIAARHLYIHLNNALLH